MQRHRLAALKTSLVPSTFVKREERRREKSRINIVAGKEIGGYTFGSVEKVVKHGNLSTFLNKLLK
jgi:hypothetical protein